MAGKTKTTSSGVPERRGSSAVDRNIASNAEAVAAGMSVAAGSLILGALLPHQADAKNPADPGADSSTRRTDPHHNAGSHVVAQGDDASPHAGQPAPATVNPAPVDQTHGVDQPPQPNPDAAHDADGMPGAHGSADVSALAATLADASHNVADDGHGAAATTGQTTSIAAAETALQGHASSPDPIVTLLGQITDTVHNATASISDSLAGTADHLITTVGNLVHTVSDTLHLPGDQLAGGGVDSLLQNAGHTTTDATASLGDAIHSATAPLVAPVAAADAAATNLAAAANHSAPADSAVDVFPTAMTSSEDFHALHIGFIGQSMANTVDAHDISTHGLGSILHGYV